MLYNVQASNRPGPKLLACLLAGLVFSDMHAYMCGCVPTCMYVCIGSGKPVTDYRLQNVLLAYSVLEGGFSPDNTLITVLLCKGVTLQGCPPCFPRLLVLCCGFGHRETNRTTCVPVGLHYCRILCKVIWINGFISTTIFIKMLPWVRGCKSCSGHLPLRSLSR